MKNVYFTVEPATAPSAFVHLNSLVADKHNPELATAITNTDNMTNKIAQRLRARDTLLPLHDPKTVGIRV